MSTAAISYSSLGDASKEAKSVAKKLDKYADSLYDNVYKKLNNYNGPWSSNLSTAKSQVNNKINELRTEQSKYETYATDLTDLRDECKEVDKAVKSRVSSLTASFKEAYGIRNSKIENAINNFVTGLGNKTAFGRWLGGKWDDFQAGKNYLKDSIKTWYNYEGGKELIKGVLVGLLEVAIGVLAIVGTILSGGALLVVIAGVVGGLIAVANGIANLYNEEMAYLATYNNDPATGRRRSEIDSWQDFMRSSFVYGADGETYHYNKSLHNWATAIDVTSFVCTAITLVNSCGKLINRGLNWANGTAKIPLKDYFNKNTYVNFFQKAWGGLSNGTKEIFASIKAGDWTFMKTAFKNFKLDFAANFKDNLMNFDSVKDKLKTTKNILGIGKDLIKGDFSLGTIGETIVTKIVLPNVTVFKPNEMTIESNEKFYWFSTEGQIKFNFDHIVMDDFYGIMDDFGSKIIGNPLFERDNELQAVLNKMSIPSAVDISVPAIDMPSINISPVNIQFGSGQRKYAAA